MKVPAPVWSMRPVYAVMRQNQPFGATDYAYVNPNYTLTSVPAWQEGSASVDGSPVNPEADLHGVAPNWSIYFTDTLTLAKTVNVTVSGRYNRFTKGSDYLN